MNGRTAYKLLIRGRTRNFWGRRAYFTIRIPLSAISETYPKFDSVALGLGEPDNWGVFEKSEDGRLLRTRFEWDEDVPGLVGEVCVYDADAYRAFIERGVGAHPGILERKPVPKEIVDKYASEQAWAHKYAKMLEYPKGHPLEYLADAVKWCKTTYYEVVGDALQLTYSVKYFYPERARRFAAAAKKAINVARKRGVVCRAVAGVPGL